MKILLCHNFYQQPGGEDQSFADEAQLLEERGHRVIPFTRHNDTIESMSRWDVARRTVWNSATLDELTALINRERPDIMHCTNTFPLISPAAYQAARRHGIPIVQALRNYRLLCPAALLLRDGKVCESCLGKAVPWPAIMHGCYRQSRLASAVVSGMLVTHRFLRTWARQVDLFFTLTNFARRKFIEGGLPGDRVAVKVNFIHPDPGVGSGSGGFAVFVGRLAPEKGIDTLLKAWSQLPLPIPLKIVGDGPLSASVAKAADNDSRIQWLGRRNAQEVLTIIGEASFLVMPSIWYETFGRTIIEAFACGTPVIVSRLGAMAELVEHGRTGLLFEAGNSNDLAAQVAHFLTGLPRHARMRNEARRTFEENYTAAQNYRGLMDLYSKARAIAARRYSQADAAT